MENFYKQFCSESFDENGTLSEFSIKCPDDFNFAFDVVDKIAELEPDRKALVWCNEKGEEKIITFSQMKEYSDKAANLLIRHGVKKGDMIMLILKRHYQFWYSIMALHKIGAIAIPATNLLTKKDLVYRFNAATVSGIICTSEGNISDYVEQAQEESSSLNIKFMAKGCKNDSWLDFDALVEKEPAASITKNTKALDPMLLYFTSGTTGYPKMALHDYSYPLAHIVTARHWHNVVPGGLHLTVSDTGWAKSMWGKLYGQWLCGTSIFVYDYDKFDSNELLKIIEKYEITTFCAPPTIYRFLIKSGMEKYNLSSLKYCTIAGEALNPEVFNRFLEFTGLKLMEGFGQTEMTLVVANLYGMTPKSGSMGKPSPLYNVDLIDENGKSTEAGEVGEIVIRTTDQKQYGMFSGYYRDENKTNDVWHGGIYHTGDTAWKDEDGYFWYVGRTDDLIKASGYRIGPFEIESVLMEHPSVLECAVTGAPDPIRGQVVKATIVLTKNYIPSEELKKELQEHVKKLTAPYKYPRIIDFVNELPKTISGKIRRVQIREESNN